MGFICFLLGEAFGCIVTVICMKRYMFNEWYLKGQADLIEAMREKELTNDIDNIPGVEKMTESEEHSSKFKIAKDIIKKNFKDGDCGLFNTRSFSGDRMTTLYRENGLRIDICYEWAYFEVFGLTEEEFLELEDYYRKLEKNEEV